MLNQRQRLLFMGLAGCGSAGRLVSGPPQAPGSEDAGAAHRDGLHDGALAAGPGAWWQRAEAAAHRHLAEHGHAHHAAVLLHGEGVHAAQTQAPCLRQVHRDAARVMVDAARRQGRALSGRCSGLGESMPMPHSPTFPNWAFHRRSKTVLC